MTFQRAAAVKVVIVALFVVLVFLWPDIWACMKETF